MQTKFLVKVFFGALFFFVGLSFIAQCVSAAYTADIGDGADGAVTISTAKNINTQTIASGRIYADGIAYRVNAPADLSNTVTRYSGSVTLSNGIAAGDEVLLINLQGTSADNADVGNFEFMEVQSVSVDTITFTSAITASFDGSSASNQKVIIQRVPNYTDVTLSGTGSLTAQAWDGLTATPSGAAGYYTGIVAFRANGTVNVASGTSISVAAKGFRGGSGSGLTGAQGESYAGIGAVTDVANYGGGGGSQSIGDQSAGSGGGGGSFGTSGGWGGVTRAAPGNIYGSTIMEKIYLGSGGGGGRRSQNYAQLGGNGGVGGGIIYISGSNISLSGGITANGGTGTGGGNTPDSSQDGGPGGGASGGGVYLSGNTFSIGSSLVTSTGGSYLCGDECKAVNNSGPGGTGRIFIQYTDSVTGTTNPTAVTERLEDAPIVTTQAASNITTTAASVSGNIISTGNIDPERFIEYGTTSGSYTQSCTAGTAGEGIYSCNLTNLTPNTTYYFRAKATNAIDTTYGDELSFTTLVDDPQATTQLPTVITTVSAQGNGTITDTGGEDPERFLEWGTQSNTYTHNCSAGTGSTGSYACNMTGLFPNTTYYLRAYATNSAGTAYGDELQFTTYPASPQNLSATDGTHTDKVTVTWNAPTNGADGYKISTDGGNTYTDIGNTTTYEDTTAPQPTIEEGTTEASDGTHTDHTTLTSTASVTNGSERTYTVIAYNTQGDSTPTASETGYRGAGSLTYQWQVSQNDTDANYTDITNATTNNYNDTNAPEPTITPGTITASDGTQPSVLLTSTGHTTTDGEGRYYRLTLTSPDAQTITSTPDRGYRGSGSITYQWHVSQDDTDSNYTSITGATTNPYTYTSAPVNGDGRYFQCVYSAPGAQSVTSNTDRGYRTTLTVQTNTATSIQTNQATLNGTVTDTGGIDPTNRYIEYGTTTSYTDQCTAGAGQAGTFSCIAQPLQPNTTYHFRACATTPERTACGSDNTFTTLVDDPTTTTQPPTVITTNSAAGNGTITDTGGEDPERFIEWGTQTNTYTDHCSAGTGGTGTYTCSMTSLQPNTTYYVRAYATNSAGTAYGSELSFTTNVDLPTVTTQETSNITTNSAQGNGTVTYTGNENPERFIEWGTTSGTYTNSCTAGTGPTGAYSCSLTGLNPNTTYYTRAKVTNAGGTNYGTETSFTTAIADPAVTTNTPSNITTNSAQGNGTITDTGGDNPERFIQWGTTSGNYTDQCSASTGSTGTYSCNMTGLNPNTTYYVRAKATNGASTQYGSETSFTTLVDNPQTTTELPTVITTISAQGNGTITDTGGEDPERFIQWGTQSNIYTHNCSAGTGSTGTYACQMTGLFPNTTYYVRAYATNSAGTSYGDELSFETQTLTDLTIIDPNIPKIENAVQQGYMSVTNGTQTNAQEVRANVNITVQSGSTHAQFPTNTYIQETNTNAFNFQNFTLTPLNVKNEQPTSRNAFRLGIEGTNLTFSNPITITTTIGEAFNNLTLDILYQNEGESTWNTQTTCTVQNGECTFQTDHATIYTINGSHQVTGDAPVNINVEVQSTLSMDCYESTQGSGTYDVFLGTTSHPGSITAGTPAIGQSTCDVTTNDDQGYYLTIEDDNKSATTTLTHTDPNTGTIYEIDDLSQYTFSSPNTITWNTPTTKGLGFSVISFPDTNLTNNQFNTTWTTTGDLCQEGTTTDNAQYTGIPNTPETIAAVTQYESDTTTTHICYKVDVPPSQPSGIYQGSVTYTATSDASSYLN